MANSERRLDPRGVRRIVVGFGAGFLFAGGPFILLLFREDPSTPITWPVAVALFVSFGACAPLAFFSAFSWALFYRCPNCKRRLKRLKREPLPDEWGYSLHYECHDCHILWDVFWQERADL